MVAPDPTEIYTPSLHDALPIFALESQRRAAKAEQEGRFRSRIPVRDPETGQVVLEKDEHPRSETTAEGLAALAPSFVAKIGKHTSELQSLAYLVCRLLLEKKNQ